MSSLGLSGNSGSSAGTSSTAISLQGTKDFLQSNSLVAKFAFFTVDY